MAEAEKGVRIQAYWATCMDPATRCDMLLIDPASEKHRACATRMTIGAQMWLEEHIYLSPNQAQRSYCVTRCEHCRLTEIAREWLDAGDVPEFKIATGSAKGLAGAHLLTPEQYKHASALVLQLEHEQASAAPKTPEPAGPARSGDALAAREQRKVKASKDSRGGLG